MKLNINEILIGAFCLFLCNCASISSVSYDEMFVENHPKGHYYRLQETTLGWLREEAERDIHRMYGLLNGLKRQYQEYDQVVNHLEGVKKFEEDIYESRMDDIAEVEETMRVKDKLYEYKYDSGESFEYGWIVLTREGKIRKRLVIERTGHLSR